METEYKYDVAISCAEEDIEIAKKITAEFKKVNISYYLYTEHMASHWGENIYKVTLDKYGAESRFLLMLISKVYVQKKWSDVERQIAQTIQRIGEAYILPLQLESDIVSVDGLGKNIHHIKWIDNPEEIAKAIKEKLSGSHGHFQKDKGLRANIFNTQGDTTYIESVRDIIIKKTK